jgi:hypothetical protein
MKFENQPIIAQRFIEKLGKTAIETPNGTVWANGDTSNNGARIVSIVINEVGDKFIAQNDSKTLKDGKPLFLKGETVTRLKQSMEFKSFDGAGSATEFAKAASVFGTQLIVQM